MTTKTIYSLLLALATTVVIAQNNEVKSLEQVLTEQNQSKGPNSNAQRNANSNASFNNKTTNTPTSVATLALTDLLTQNLGSIYFLQNQANHYGNPLVRLYTDSASFQNITSLQNVALVELLVITISHPSELQAINLNNGHIDNLTNLKYIYLDFKYEINNPKSLNQRVSINNPDITVFYNIVIPQ